MNKDHILLKCSDFTKDELEDDSHIISTFVCENGYSICSLCGKAESELDEECEKGE